MQLWRAFRNAPKFDRDMALTMMFGLSQRGIPSDQWDPLLLERALKYPDNSHSHATALYYAHAFALENDDLSKATLYFEEMMQISKIREFYNLANFVRPGVLGETAEFRRGKRL